MTQAGSYRRRVSVQKQVQTRDTFGGVQLTWADVWKHVPCSIAPYRGRELFFAQQTQADLTWKIAFRWRPNINASMRLVEQLGDGKTMVYNIEAVMPDETNRREVTLLCKTRQEQGFRSDGA